MKSCANYKHYLNVSDCFNKQLLRFILELMMLKRRFTFKPKNSLCICLYNISNT